MSNIDLKILFEGLQNQMIAQLNTNREFIQHATTKGDSLENAWIEWLRIYLPNRYNVDKAIVVDHLGNLSDQMDLVIYDQQYTPFVFSQNGVHYIPAEGVYAVFEVKPEIDKEYIGYTGDKIASVRKLNRTSINIIDKGKPENRRPLPSIVGGILALTGIGLNTAKTHIENLSGLRTIDIGCAVDKYAFFVEYSDPTNNSITDLNKRIEDFYSNRSLVNFSHEEGDYAFIFFFLNLISILQTLGTVPAIDIKAYGKNFM